jgi:hypothetical protein
VIEVPAPGGRSATVLGVVRGLVSEADRLAERLEAIAPARVGVAIAPDELASYQNYFVGVETEPFVPLSASEAVEVRELGKYGEVRVPHPSLLRAMTWARDHDRPVDALDPTEDEYAEMFAEHIGYWELVRRTVRERNLLRSPPKAPDADRFVLAWDARLHPGRGSARLRAARESHVAGALAALSAEGGPVAVVVDRERVPGLLAALG